MSIIWLKMLIHPLLSLTLFFSWLSVTTAALTMKTIDEELDDMLLPPIEESSKVLRGGSDVDTYPGLESSEIVYDYEVGFEDIVASSWTQEMLNFINTERQKAGEGPLCINSKLSSAAQSHTEDMVDKDFFSHTGSDGSGVGTRVTREDYKWRTVAENIAINSSVAGAHASFMKSSGHRANILSSKYTHIGFAKATQTSGRWKGRQYYTQVFGSSSSESCTGSDIGGSGGGGSTGDDKTKPCSDSPQRWYDRGGAVYDCDWYKSSSRFNCKAYGDKYRNFGKTANEACCICGGGSFN